MQSISKLSYQIVQMEPQIESEPSALRHNLITIDRPDSAQLVDLHIYIIPNNVWQEQKNLAENDAIEQAMSAGFVRIPQNLTIYDLRQHIVDVCGQEDGFPKEFIYLRSVGRCLAKVKPQQELELRTFAPEIYVLEGHHDDDSSLTSKSKSSLSRESTSQSSTITTTTSRQESWTKSTVESPLPIATLRALLAQAKLREEQERLRLRQIELARQRREIEVEQQRRKTIDSAQSNDSETEDKKPLRRKDDIPTRDIEPEKLKAVKEQEEQRQQQQQQRREIELEEKKRKDEHEKRQREIEQEEKKKREHDLLEQYKSLSKLEREKQEEEAAIRIQASYRGYQTRRQTKEQKQRQ
ncbi:hypothetical protein I4U23_030700 [Adineta vaga]|nr:hypothetical protein I4U23_030700 [Adineta vaga]